MRREDDVVLLVKHGKGYHRCVCPGPENGKVVGLMLDEAEYMAY